MSFPATLQAMRADRAARDQQLHEHIERFFRDWSPSLSDRPGGPPQFHADLMMLVTAIHRHSMTEVEALLAAAMTCMPPFMPVARQQESPDPARRSPDAPRYEP